MGILTVRLYLLLMHSLFPQYQQVSPGIDSVQKTLRTLNWKKGPVTLIKAGPMELHEFTLLQNEKKH